MITKNGDGGDFALAEVSKATEQRLFQKAIFEDPGRRPGRSMGGFFLV